MPVCAHGRGFVDDFRRVQQGFGRDTANVEADAAQVFPAFDQCHRDPKVRRAKRSRVATGPGAQHHQLRRDRRVAQAAAPINAAGSASIFARYTAKRAPSAPSIRR